MYRYHKALADQPSFPLLPNSGPLQLHLTVPLVLFIIGQTFVITSTLALGVTGTFLGDYFGILMDSRVEGFPFNVLENPMYTGSTLCFIATALWCVIFHSNLVSSSLIAMQVRKTCRTCHFSVGAHLLRHCAEVRGVRLSK